MREVKSSLNRSRTTLTSMSGSSYMVTGLEPRELISESARVWMSSHRRCRRSTSAAMASSETFSAAVRMMAPPCPGTTLARISLRRLRSGPGSLREMPALRPPGTYTR